MEAEDRLNIDAFNLLLQGPNSEVTYSITGDEEAQEFFAIDPLEGTVVLRKSLVDVPTARYTVSEHPKD